MRVNPFARLERQGNYVKGDCSYINDFGSWVFERVCQLDSYSAGAMTKAGVYGTEECKYGTIRTCLPLDIDESEDDLFWAQVGNKDFVALWIEDEYKAGVLAPVIFGIYNHDGKYYLTKCYIDKLRSFMYTGDINKYVSERMRLGIVAAVG